MLATQTNPALSAWPNVLGRAPSRLTAPRVRRARIQIPGHIQANQAYHPYGVDNSVPASAGVEVFCAATETPDG
jgi:hypothetical protein